MSRRFQGKELLIATHNPGKLEEIRQLLDPFGVHLLSAAELGLTEPVETETTFVGNARIKAYAAVAASGLPTLADDSGICINALGGAPGVFTADWAETPDGRDFDMAMRDTWEKLQGIGAVRPITAQFCSTMVLAWPDSHDEAFEGVVAGQVVWPGRGHGGHGYDPIFQPDGYKQTFGEMDSITKNRISHRANAFRKLIDACFI